MDADSDKIVGYYTLSVVAVAHSELPGRVRRNTPNPVPAVLLGRLAINVLRSGRLHTLPHRPPATERAAGLTLEWELRIDE